MWKRALLALGCSLSFAVHAQAFERPGALLEQADTNEDGLLTLEEFKAARAAAFPKRDRNGDGHIDDADLSQLSSARPRARAAAEEMTAQLDLDGDGKITQQEFVDGAVAAFNRADGNGDGVLDAKERDAAKAAMRERIQQRRAG